MQVVNYPQLTPFVRYELQFSQLSFRTHAPPTAFSNPTFIQSYWRRLAWSAAAAAPLSGTYKPHPVFARYAMYTNTRT